MNGPPIKRTRCFTVPHSAKRYGTPLYPPAKRTCVREEPPPPQQDAFVAHLLRYIQSLEERITALERQRGPPEPFVHEPGIVVF